MAGYLGRHTTNQATLRAQTDLSADLNEPDLSTAWPNEAGYFTPGPSHNLDRFS